jgi:NAD kinase
MNVLWLSAPYRKDDIMANKDAVWVYTENEEQNGGGEITEFMRSAENCHPLIVRQHHGKDGFYKEDNILRTTQVIERYFNSLFIKIKQGKLAILPTIDINEAMIELEKNAPSLHSLFVKNIEITNRYKTKSLI